MWYRWMVDPELHQQPTYSAPIVQQRDGRWEVEEAKVQTRDPKLSRDTRWLHLDLAIRRRMGLHCDQLAQRFGHGEDEPALGVAVVRAKLGFLFGAPSAATATSSASFRYLVEVSHRSEAVQFSLSDDLGKRLVVAIRHDGASPARIRAADRVLWELLLRASLADFQTELASGLVFGSTDGQPYARTAPDRQPTVPLDRDIIEPTEHLDPSLAVTRTDLRPIAIDVTGPYTEDADTDRHVGSARKTG